MHVKRTSNFTESLCRYVRGQRSSARTMICNNFSFQSSLVMPVLTRSHCVRS